MIKMRELTTEASQKEMAEKFIPKLLNSKTYNKFAKAWVRPAKVGEKIETITSDGKETESVAGEDDYVVKAQTGAQEQYIISKNKLISRYKPLDNTDGEWSEYQAVGSVRGFEWDQDTLTFEASWGEGMIIKRGDMLVTPDGKEVYRIARKEFEETYR